MRRVLPRDTCMEEVIRKILQVEEEAKAIVERGEREANDVLENARKDVRRIVDDAQTNAREQAARLVEEAVAAAREAARKYLDEEARAAEKSVRVDDSSREKAVQLVMKSLGPD